MNRLLYRKAVLSDLNKLTELEKTCFTKYDVFSRRTLRRMIQNPAGTILLDVFIYDSDVSGYAIYLKRSNSKSIRLYSVCLKQDLTGQGLIKTYLEERIKGFSNKYSRITLEVRLSNEKAVKLYRGLGFMIKQVLEGYYPDGEKGYRMAKDL